MTRKPSCHLIDMLAKVPDPRNNKGKRHPLKSILALLVIGLMCGHKARHPSQLGQGLNKHSVGHISKHLVLQHFTIF